MKIPQEVRRLIESGCDAHLVTLNRDGSPQVTLVWIGIDGDEIVAGHLPRNQKVRNIERDPRVAYRGVARGGANRPRSSRGVDDVLPRRGWQGGGALGGDDQFGFRRQLGIIP